jgi:hypothetical protein
MIHMDAPQNHEARKKQTICGMLPLPEDTLSKDMVTCKPA